MPADGSTDFFYAGVVDRVLCRGPQSEAEGETMNDRPALLIEYDPDTFEAVAVFFKANSDLQTEALKIILRAYCENVRQGNEAGGVNHDTRH